MCICGYICLCKIISYYSITYSELSWGKAVSYISWLKRYWYPLKTADVRPQADLGGFFDWDFYLMCLSVRIGALFTLYKLACFVGEWSSGYKYRISFKSGFTNEERFPQSPFCDISTLSALIMLNVYFCPQFSQWVKLYCFSFNTRKNKHKS